MTDEVYPHGVNVKAGFEEAACSGKGKFELAVELEYNPEFPSQVKSRITLRVT